MKANPHIEIVHLTVAINDDLSQAIAYYELSAPSALSAPLIERVNQHLIHEGFNVVSEALELGVITILCRIWDKRRGTARITEVVSRLRKNPSVVPTFAYFHAARAYLEAWGKPVALVREGIFTWLTCIHAEFQKRIFRCCSHELRRCFRGRERMKTALS